MRARAVLVLIVVIAVAAVAWASLGGLAGPESPRESLIRTFSPPYPAAPPAGQIWRIDKASVSEDGLTLTVVFFGGPGYLRSDPCSEQDVPWVAPDGDALDVAIVEVVRADQATTAPGIACPDGSVQHTYQLGLAAPFRGVTINDLSGQTFEAHPAPTGS